MSIKLRPIDEARFLYNMMRANILSDNKKERHQSAKNCAWECVDEIMGHTGSDIDYWMKVKKKIEKL
jgi:hypothetical protein